MTDARITAQQREQNAHEAIKAYETEYENGDAARTTAEHVQGLTPLYDELEAAEAEVAAAQG